VEFLGRIRSASKNKSYRIRAGGDRTAPIGSPGYQKCSCNAIGSSGGRDGDDRKSETHLCAYIVSAKTFAVPELIKHLAHPVTRLHDPFLLYAGGRNSLTVSGKVKSAGTTAVEPMATGTPYEAPRNPLEEKLVTIWSDILKLKPEKIGILQKIFLKWEGIPSMHSMVVGRVVHGRVL